MGTSNPLLSNCCQSANISAFTSECLSSWFNTLATLCNPTPLRSPHLFGRNKF